MQYETIHQPCPCGKSSDAYCTNKDGSGKCYSCGEFFPSKKKGSEMASLQKITDKIRGISPKTYDFYGAKVEVQDDGELSRLVFTRPDGKIQLRPVAKRKSAKPEHGFRMEGEAGQGLALFGSDKFSPGSARAITITEGYLDALSTYEMNGGFPAVGVQSKDSAKGECAQAFDYLNSFDKIYICFDADPPGKEAASKVARLFDFNKVYIVKLDPELKDPNEYLDQGKTKEFVRTWWASTRYLPEGIVSSYSEFDKIIDEDGEKPSIPYPFEELQRKTYGIRTGELILLTAQEGIGKTEIFRALEYNILKNTEDKIGIIHLEENKARTLKGLAGYELGVPVHLPEYATSKDEIKSTIRKVTGDDERVHIYSHFGSDDPDVILDTVRFLAGACNCKYIFLDHITMVVSGLQGDDERRALDYLSTRLAMMVEELDFTLFLISHVNDEGQTRGSRNISKVADLRIDLNRNLQAEGEKMRNTTFLTISKNRFSGKTGPAGRLFFDHETYILSEEEEEIPS